MVAFVLTFVLAMLGFWFVLWYGKRRPVGTSLSWGEAMAAASGGFFLMFWVYGVVPHQWLAWSDNELNWRSDRILLESGEWQFLNMPLPPFTVNYENLSHMIVIAIYGLFLAMHVAIWVIWQNRGKEKPAELPASQYGRPLVKQA